MRNAQFAGALTPRAGHCSATRTALPSAQGSASPNASATYCILANAEQRGAGIDHEQLRAHWRCAVPAQMLLRGVVLHSLALKHDEVIAGLHRRRGRNDILPRIEIHVVWIQVVRTSVAEEIRFSDHENSRARRRQRGSHLL